MMGGKEDEEEEIVVVKEGRERGCLRGGWLFGSIYSNSDLISLVKYG